jgi:hypothetical protein
MGLLRHIAQQIRHQPGLERADRLWATLRGPYHKLLDLLSRHRPELLLSVHPAELPAYGQSEESLRGLLAQFGYTVTTIAVDHEEHWWCCPAA